MSDRSRPESNQTVLSVLPGGRSASSDEVAVAVLVAGSALTLYALRRGLKGIGQLQLTGSTVRGLETAAYLVIIGATFRTIQTQFPESRFSRAINFIY